MNFVALAYRNNSQISQIYFFRYYAIFIKILFIFGITQINLASALTYHKIRSFALQITPFCRDFVHAQHNSSKLGSAFAYHKIRSADDTDTMRIIILK